LQKNKTIKLQKSSPAEWPVQGIEEFFRFNFSEVRCPTPQILSPFNLVKKIEIQLYKIRQRQGWVNNGDIVHKLNLPNYRQVLHSPMNFKYVYDYVEMYRTHIFNVDLEVSSDILIKPANKNKIKKFYAFLS